MDKMAKLAEQREQQVRPSMDVLDAGHVYRLLDRPYDKVTAIETVQEITFVKRICPTAPHEVQWDGLICQDLIRVLIDRVKYLQAQQPCVETEKIIAYLQQSLWLFEYRTWKKRFPGKLFPFQPGGIETYRVDIEGHLLPLW